MKYDIDILNSQPILDVAEKLGIQTNGRKPIKCFLHTEKTPSLSFDIKRNRWKCYGCGEGGSVIDLVMKWNKQNFQDACSWLCGRSCNLKARLGVTNYVKPQNLPKKEIVNQPDCEVYKWIIDNLTISDNAKDYLTICRMLPESIIDDYHIKSYDPIRDKYFKQSCLYKFGETRLIKCGIIKKQKRNDSDTEFNAFVWYQDGLLFPFFDEQNNIIFIQQRLIGDVKGNKYRGLYGVKLPLYNLNLLPKLRPGRDVYICEGVFDCISLGLMKKNAIGVIGTNGFKLEFIDVLKSYNIFMIPDRDTAGEKFALQIESLFNKVSVNVGIGGPLPKDCKDVTDYYVKHGKNNR